MRDVSEKNVSLRVAVARSCVEMPPEVLLRLKARTLDKGDALEIARAAAILGAKRTWELLPLCHPIPVERLDLHYEFGVDRVTIFVEVATHARTGIEMEALTAASICALCLYDMLKPHAGTNLIIRETLLLKKTGGKSSDFERSIESVTPGPAAHPSPLARTEAMSLATRTLLENYYAAFNRQDWTTFLGLLTDDVIHDVNQGGREVGKAAFAKFMEKMNRSYSEQIVDIVVCSNEDGSRAAVEFTVLGKYLKTDEGLPEANGQTYRLPAGAFFDIRDGKVARVTNYYNLADWLKQVGA